MKEREILAMLSRDARFRKLKMWWVCVFALNLWSSQFPLGVISSFLECV